MRKRTGSRLQTKIIAYVAVDSAIGDYQSNNNASTEHWDTELYRQILLCVPFQKEYRLFYSWTAIKKVDKKNKPCRRIA